eukprot:scaffold27063_cov64-Phaeocystis_antarctica.AAC.8
MGSQSSRVDARLLCEVVLALFLGEEGAVQGMAQLPRQHEHGGGEREHEHRARHAEEMPCRGRGCRRLVGTHGELGLQLGMGPRLRLRDRLRGVRLLPPTRGLLRQAGRLHGGQTDERRGITGEGSGRWRLRVVCGRRVAEHGWIDAVTRVIDRIAPVRKLPPAVIGQLSELAIFGPARVLTAVAPIEAALDVVGRRAHPVVDRGRGDADRGAVGAGEVRERRAVGSRCRVGAALGRARHARPACRGDDRLAQALLDAAHESCAVARVAVGVEREREERFGRAHRHEPCLRIQVGGRERAVMWARHLEGEGVRTTRREGDRLCGLRLGRRRARVGLTEAVAHVRLAAVVQRDGGKRAADVGGKLSAHLDVDARPRHRMAWLVHERPSDLRGDSYAPRHATARAAEPPPAMAVAQRKRPDRLAEAATRGTRGGLARPARLGGLVRARDVDAVPKARPPLGIFVPHARVRDGADALGVDHSPDGSQLVAPRVGLVRALPLVVSNGARGCVGCVGAAERRTATRCAAGGVAPQPEPPASDRSASDAPSASEAERAEHVGSLLARTSANALCLRCETRAAGRQLLRGGVHRLPAARARDARRQHEACVASLEEHIGPNMEGPSRVCGDAFDRLPLGGEELVDRAVGVRIVRALEGGHRARRQAEAAAEGGEQRRVHEALAVLYRPVSQLRVKCEDRGCAAPRVGLNAAVGLPLPEIAPCEGRGRSIAVALG